MCIFFLVYKKKKLKFRSVFIFLWDIKICIKSICIFFFLLINIYILCGEIIKMYFVFFIYCVL